ncbi:MAG: aroB1 [Candidatus Saganbacteria bacterium]|uniref:3-dehydroquinate synthase n=1 Tax=Candidatus Saganbacteria bacterium TaxID=2575572 RepID=A0A833KZR4_UNCSA|nr:MAG: aroB1 [Candidatus Saganbacteria bacterium]
MAGNIKVNLKERSYEIIIGSGKLEELKEYVKNKSRIIIITDYTVGSLYGKKLQKTIKASSLIEIPPGEKYKSLSTAAAVYDKMIGLNAARDSLVVALGGGVIGDLSGFVAATYMRGIDLIQVPTTLLAMVDASIGGKTAVDHKMGKNLIGAFYQPKKVIIDTDALNTLPPGELKNGLAEVLKYGLIKDTSIIDVLDSNPKISANFWESIIIRCAKIKADIVSKDERELSGERMILNFGHTIGHAVESLSKYKKYSHGEAVGFGMLAASRIALNKKLIDVNKYEMIKNLIKKLKLPDKVNVMVKNILESVKMDKKVRNGKINFVLPVDIGKVKVFNDVSDQAIKEALMELGCK